MRKLTWLAVLLLLIFQVMSSHAQGSRPPITPDNAGELTRLGYLGRGGGTAVALQGEHLALASEAGVWLYKAADLTAPPLRLEGYEFGYDFVALSPDGSQVAALAVQEARVWDTTTGTLLYQVETSAGGAGIHYSPDGQVIMLVNDNPGLSATFITAADGTEIALHSLASDSMLAGVFSPEGTQAALAGNDGSVHFIDPQTGEQLDVLGNHPYPLIEIAWSPDGTMIAAGDAYNQVMVWDVAEETQITLLEGHSGPIEDVLFSADGQYLITADDNENTLIWSVATWERVRRLESDTLITYDLALEGDQLVSVGAETGMQVWNWTMGDLLAEVPTGSSYAVDKISTTQDGQYAVLSAQFEDVSRYDLTTFQPVPFAMPTYSSVSQDDTISPDGRRLATVRYNAEINLWDTTSGELMQAFTLFGEDDDIAGMAFSPDGTHLAVSGGQQQFHLYVLDLVSGEMIFDVPNYYAAELQFTPDNEILLASANQFGQVVAWNLKSQERFVLLEGHTDYAFEVMFSADYTRIISGGSDGQIIAWDIETGEEVYRIEVGGDYGVSTMALSPDGSMIATAITEYPENHQMQLWDAATGELLASYTTSTSYYEVAFSGDGSLLLGGGYNGVIDVWGVAL